MTSLSTMRLAHSTCAGTVRTLRAAKDRFLRQIRGDQDGLIAILLHAVVPAERDIGHAGIAPRQIVTVPQVRLMIESFLRNGYQATDPAAIERGISGEKHLLLTFDDGYANNLLLLPLLEEYRMHATVFVATHYCKTNTAFWWDAHERLVRRRGGTDAEAARERGILKGQRSRKILEELYRIGGPGALVPQGELDRPLTPEEVRSLHRHPLVTIGNHTVRHAILTLEDAEGIEEEITTADRDLTTITGTKPSVLSYPNGNWTPAIEACARKAGYGTGCIVLERKNALPLRHPLRIARFPLWHGTMRAWRWRGVRGGKLL